MPKTFKLLSWCTVLSLSACGGGGDSTPFTALPTQTPLAMSVTATPSINASLIGHDAINAHEVMAFQTIHETRTQCGFGALQYHSALAAAAKGHATWMLTHQQFDHQQDPTQFPYGFTGRTLFDRIDAQQTYFTHYKASEIFTVDQINASSDNASTGIHRLLNAPYHAYSLLNGYRDIGLSVLHAPDLGNSQHQSRVIIANLALSSTQAAQELSPQEIATYPCQGSRNVAYQLTHEQPNPVPTRDLSIQPLGVSILIKVKEGQRLELDYYAITQQLTKQLIVTRQPVGGANGTIDPYGYFNHSIAFLSTDAPLLPNTTYDVIIEGKNDGQLFSKAFSFETGSYF